MNNLKTTLFFLCFITSSHMIYSQKNDEANISTYKNFDFISGEKILFYDDFSKGLIHWDIVEWDLYEESQKGRITTYPNTPGNWYFMPRKGTSKPKVLGALPNHFTVEYDFFIDENVSEHEGGILNIFVKQKGLNIEEYSYHFDDNPQIKLAIKPANDILYLNAWREYSYADGINGDAMIFEDIRENYWVPNQVHRISISRNGSHVNLYVNQEKVMDFPNALPANEDYTLLLCNNLWINGYYISNIKIASGLVQPDVEFKDNKPYVTQNILFDVNSDKIKPSSYQTLKQISQAIKEVEGKILIVGHTDSDGDADKNMELSKRRSNSVKNVLVTEFGIDSARLETEGKGQTEPINSNDTVQDKANNRRVEFIKVE
jgi:outer membrane protein OmpA-like peptidoglycan-associated protein